MIPTLIHIVCISGPDAGLQFVVTSITDAIAGLQAVQQASSLDDLAGRYVQDLREPPQIPTAEELTEWFGRS